MGKARDVLAWAEQVSDRQRTCTVCNLGPEAAKDIEAILDRHRQGKPIVKQTQMTEWLCNQYGAMFSPKTLGAHIKYCLKRDWRTGGETSSR